MQNNAIIAMMQHFMPGFTMEEMEFGPEEFEAEALGMYEEFVRSRTAPKAREAAGGGSSAPRKRTKKAAPRPLIELPPSYEEDGSAAAAGQLVMASAPTEILSKVFLLLGPLNSYGQLSLVNKHWREALQVTEELQSSKHQSLDLVALCTRNMRFSIHRSVMLPVRIRLTLALHTVTHCHTLSRCRSYGLI
jgi:hypothetical protein